MSTLLESTDNRISTAAPTPTCRFVAADDEPIRAEQFGLDHLEAHAKKLAPSAANAAIGPGKDLLAHIRRNQDRLIQAHGIISKAYAMQEPFGADAEWLLDNVHIISDTLNEIKEDLPQGYYRLLPKMKETLFEGFPRVYVLALELVSHCDSSLDENNITRFIKAFQTEVPLTIGELWAFPIMLRVVLIENLRRLAENIVKTRQHREGAKCWAERFQAHSERSPGAPAMEFTEKDCSDAFLVHLLDFVRADSATAMCGVDSVDKYLSSCGQNAVEVQRREQARQAANQVSIGNCVTSLRLVSALDWSDFFERTSHVEEILRMDPAGVYGLQDFATRDRYRRVIEKLARRCKKSEIHVAQAVLDLAEGHGRGKKTATPSEKTKPGDGLPWGAAVPEQHVGYFLIDKGRRQLEAQFHYVPTIVDACRELVLSQPLAIYFGSFFSVIGLILLGMGWLLSPITTAPVLGIALVLAALPASALAMEIVNYLATWWAFPRVLPKLLYKNGIPTDCATFVVVPSMLVRDDSASMLVERLEIHYLSNPDSELRFALLTDCADASTESMPEDERFVKAAQEGIAALNRRYCANMPDRFFLFHRRRLWNPAEGCWMGWERKRGKLLEFNRLLRGHSETSFHRFEGDWKQLPPIRFVITLDTDTQMPRESARKLVGILAHPLNRARFDEENGRVIAGYGVLQPRVGLSLTGSKKSTFASVYSGSAGLDPYTTAVSDTYQDLFGVGSFTGKGIYDLDAFHAATDRRFPENKILSHDLIEGNFARCGLVTDVEFIDEFPSSYLAYSRREHRWARGDWQIFNWIFPRVPNAQGTSEKNPLPALERWKILDNLRRGLLPPAMMLLLGLGFTVLPGSPWIWAGLVLAAYFWPFALQVVHQAVQKVRQIVSGRPSSWEGSGLWSTGCQALLNLVFLPHQAWVFTDAIARTLVRLFVTKKHLLEWETSASTEKRVSGGAGLFARNMAIAPLFALALLAVILWIQPSSLPAAAAWIAGWFFSPLVAFWVSMPKPAPRAELTAGQRRYLRRMAAKTWRFFDTFVTETDQWLPPDNFQEDRKEPVAHRTSPTNIGFYLLSSLSAHDFGYLSLSSLAERLEKTFGTLDRLEKWNGHFCNWYDTRTLHVLQPGYISTVDSGNLLGSFVALAQGLMEKAKKPADAPAFAEGLWDVLVLIELEAKALEKTRAPLIKEAVQRIQSEAHHAHSVLNHLITNLENRKKNTPQSSDTNWQKELLHCAERLRDLAAQIDPAHRISPRDLQYWTRVFAARIDELPEEGAAVSEEVAQRLVKLAERARKFAADMDFKKLYNDGRNLFSVGFNLSLGRLDNAHYDLLASEVALTSFLAIARGDVPNRHWFQLSRPLAHGAGSMVLLSWGGTMFEYLMPRLLLTGFAGTLLQESQRASIKVQIEYGNKRNVPWGISESAYSLTDNDQNYQYQAFGVPGLGLKRGLARDLVVAPYATFLAVDLFPALAIENLEYLARSGGEGALGFYEAIDYTRERLHSDRPYEVIKCYMAHHQGMSFLALANCLFDKVVQRRFRAEPMVHATELLLQERVPHEASLVEPKTAAMANETAAPDSAISVSRRITTPHTGHPRTHLMSTGSYTVMVTNSGAGFSTYRGIDVTRWREDRTCDPWGQFVYLRDLRSGNLWSAAYQPVRSHPPSEYEVVFSTDKAAFRRVDDEIETRMEITVSPENHAEIRRVTVTNYSPRWRHIEATGYAEIVLGPHAGDLIHPAFGKLFLETEFVPTAECLLCKRRPRNPADKPVWAVHVMAIDGPTSGKLQFETDRTAFLGRGRTAANPIVFDGIGSLSGTTGPVLDPVFSLRRRFRLAPGASINLAFSTAVADSREQALALADYYHDFHGVVHAFELAWANSQVELRHLHISAEQAHLYQRLAAHVLFAGSALRAAPEIIAANKLGQRALWRHGISGDHPIILLRVAQNSELSLVREVLQAHNFWRLKGLTCDLVIINEHETSYFEDVHQQLQNLVRGTDDWSLVDKPGGVFVRKATQLSPEDLLLLQATARCVLAGSKGTLVSQLDRQERKQVSYTPLVKQPKSNDLSDRVRIQGSVNGKVRDNLLFWNGKGGFSADGGEYEISVKLRDPRNEAGGKGESNGQEGLANRGKLPREASELSFPPAPWINVVSNPVFGFLASESGAGHTWSTNSQVNRLSPWNNDPTSDQPGEIVYLRDEVSREFWSVSPAPAPAPVNYVVKHGQGYTVYEHESNGLKQELVSFVPAHDPVKILRLRIRNLEHRPRRLSATFYTEWVLGTIRDVTALHLVPELDTASGALIGRNSFNADFSSRVAFVDVNLRPRTFTADRTEFLGRNGSIDSPAALREGALKGTVEAGRDGCAVVQTIFELKENEEKEIVFFLGEATATSEVQRILDEYKAPEKVEQAFKEVLGFWKQTLSAVTVKTPNAALDIMVNRWLLYQVLSCRLWGRSGFYQSGGAYGFRDQLQDVMALVYSVPQEARAHILRAAARQFPEGDVQHWWHPTNGGGIRTRFSDDFLWLPFAVCHYVQTTGDLHILDEAVPFLQMPLLKPEQEEVYAIPEGITGPFPLYEHCLRALARGFSLGAHGLPLMGTGDWNDGMNGVGKEGKGESVWNGWFLVTVLRQFAALCGQYGKTHQALELVEKAEKLRTSLEAHAWDGKWYRRAFFDDGTPLGSASNPECRIDSLPQTWAVISGAADPERSRQGMQAVEEYLVKADKKMILLFTPPFDDSPLEPGYIKGYIPGIRENGGQYTHAATWVVQATAMLGHGNRAMELFDLVNPITRSASPAGAEEYRIEPYVLAGDIYSNPRQYGRGGWSWYTGSASWFYRVALETILGFHLHGDQLQMEPCIPQTWPSFEMTYRHRTSKYHILVQNPKGVEVGVQSVTVDGSLVKEGHIALLDDGRQHEVVVVLG